jgi:hypothetical protein
MLVAGSLGPWGIYFWRPSSVALNVGTNSMGQSLLEKSIFAYPLKKFPAWY